MLREDHGLGVFEKMVLRRPFWLKGAEIICIRRKARNENLHEFTSCQG
jgi:hypothetical protein